jgi:hypothetical protein
MSKSGVILARTSRKVKFYRLKSGVLDSLLKPDGESPRWLNWPAVFKTVEAIWRKLSELSKEDIHSLLLYSELKKLISAAHNYCSGTEIEEILLDEGLPIENFETCFQCLLVSLSRRVFFARQ